MATDLVSFPLTDTRCSGSVSPESGISSHGVAGHFRVWHDATGPKTTLNKVKLMGIHALPAHAQTISDIKGIWSVAQVGSQGEVPLLDHLDRLGYGWFLPFEEVKFRDACGKPRYKRRLLFPRYVPFCVEHPEDAWIVKQLKGVSNTLAPPLQKKFVEEISALHTIIENGYKFDPCPELKPGRRCRIASGPLRGIEGTLIRRDDANDVVVIETQILGKGEVHVAIDTVEVID